MNRLAGWLLAIGVASCSAPGSEVELVTRPDNTTRYLSASPDEVRKGIDLSPPATRVEIVSNSGDTSVRCGSGDRAFTCSPGRRVLIEGSIERPVTRVWAENQGQKGVRLEVRIQEVVVPAEATE